MLSHSKPWCAPSQELESSHPPPPAEGLLNASFGALFAIGASGRRGGNAATVPAVDVVALYRDLRAAVPDTEEFELLAAAFNRACAEDPLGVARAIEQEALI